MDNRSEQIFILRKALKGLIEAYPLRQAGHVQVAAVRDARIALQVTDPDIAKNDPAPVDELTTTEENFLFI